MIMYLFLELKSVQIILLFFLELEKGLILRSKLLKNLLNSSVGSEPKLGSVLARAFGQKKLGFACHAFQESSAQLDSLNH